MTERAGVPTVGEPGIPEPGVSASSGVRTHRDAATDAKRRELAGVPSVREPGIPASSEGDKEI
jgi:hypothetical protein